VPSLAHSKQVARFGTQDSKTETLANEKQFMQAVDIAMETLATYINTERPSCNLNANGHGAIGPARGFVKAMLDMIRL